MIKLVIPYLILALCFWFQGCSRSTSPDDSAGNGTQTGNAFSGRILYQDGTPAAGAIVRIYPVDYVPSLAKIRMITSNVKTTDKDGYYNYSDMDSGAYNVDAALESLGVFIDSIIVSKDSSKCKVPNGILKKLGLITGISHMPGQNDTNQVRVTLYMPGTGRITKPVIGGRFGFNYMPAGSYQLIIDPTLNEYKVKIIDISLNAGDTLDLDTIQLATADTIEMLAGYYSGTWGPNKVYRVYTNYGGVPPGATLTILPGTTVLFMGTAGIGVEGTLISNGTPDNPIKYTLGFPGGSWRGINLINNCEGSSVSYCIFEYAQDALVLQVCSKATVHNNIFRYNQQTGVRIYSCSDCQNGDVKIYNNVFHDCDTLFAGGAISFYDISSLNSCTIANNVIVRYPYGIYILLNSSITNLAFDYNCFFGNKRDIYSIRDSSRIGTHMVYADPQFVSLIPGSEDYHFQAGSPCVGTGINGTDMGIYSTYDPLE